MKTRMGFVSNSSTSSFAIFGLWFDTIDKVDKAIKKAADKDGNPDNHPLVKGLTEEKKNKIRRIVLQSLGLTVVNESEDDECEDQNEGVFLGLDLENLKGKLSDKIEKIKRVNDSLLYLFKKEGKFISYAESDNG
jgi:hypothetical protein